jgi:hypothetical protein
MVHALRRIRTGVDAKTAEIIKPNNLGAVRTDIEIVAYTSPAAAILVEARTPSYRSLI